MGIGRWWLGLVVLAAACSSSSTAPADAPEGHTVRKGGAYHAPGLNDPMTSCTNCHGADLTGGAQGQPSCFTCHGKKW